MKSPSYMIIWSYTLVWQVRISKWKAAKSQSKFAISYRQKGSYIIHVLSSFLTIKIPFSVHITKLKWRFEFYYLAFKFFPKRLIMYVHTHDKKGAIDTKIIEFDRVYWYVRSKQWHLRAHDINHQNFHCTNDVHSRRYLKYQITNQD